MKGREAEGEQRSSNCDQFVGCFGKFSALPGSLSLSPAIAQIVRVAAETQDEAQAHREHVKTLANRAKSFLFIFFEFFE
ncbi:hypothetical protein ACLKA7_003292 [Drosophila subpalustris]